MIMKRMSSSAVRLLAFAAASTSALSASSTRKVYVA
jgi:hypothetical protein